MDGRSRQQELRRGRAAGAAQEADRAGEREAGQRFAGKTVRCAWGARDSARSARLPGCHALCPIPQPQFLAPPLGCGPQQLHSFDYDNVVWASQRLEERPAGPPVDEAGLAHVEIADDHHLGEFEPVKNTAMLLSCMITRASSHTHPSFPVLPTREPPLNPGQGVATC